MATTSVGRLGEPAFEDRGEPSVAFVESGTITETACRSDGGGTISIGGGEAPGGRDGLEGCHESVAFLQLYTRCSD